MRVNKRSERVALVGFLFQVIFVGLCFLFARLTKSTAMRAELWHLIGGLGVWLVVWLHSRHSRLAAEEEEELAELKRTRTSEELFEETELDTVRAKSALVVFEKYLIPGFSIAMALYLAFAAWWAGGHYWGAEQAGDLQKVAAGALGMVIISFGGFIIGRYATGLAQAADYRLLRAGGSYVMGNVLGCFIIAIAMALAHFEIGAAERVATYIIPVLMGLISVEVILNFIMDIYRPRVAGQETRPPYDSRLLGLIAEPGGIFKTIADTLNYQFGFRVSETWFYRFMEKAIVPIILVQAFGLWLLTGLVYVKPDEGAFIERFGRPRLSARDKERGLKATLYPPGLYLKWPYPIERTRTIPYGRVMSFEIGIRELEEEERGMEQPPPEGPEGEIQMMTDPDVLLWTERHADPQKEKEINFLAPSLQAAATRAARTEPAPEEEDEQDGRVPEINLVRVLIPIQYRIKQPEDLAEGETAQPVYSYCYKNLNPDEMLRNLAVSEVTHYMANRDMLSIISEKRKQAGEELLERIQARADAHDLGVKVMYVGVSMIHPPPETAKAFQEVSGAMEQMHATIYEAEAQARTIVPEARGKAAELVNQAEATRIRKTTVPVAEAKLFKERLRAYEKAPHSYLVRKYYQYFVQALKGKRKIVMPRGKDEVLIIDQEEKLKPFTDVQIGE